MSSSGLPYRNGPYGELSMSLNLPEPPLAEVEQKPIVMESPKQNNKSKRREDDLRQQLQNSQRKITYAQRQLIGQKQNLIQTKVHDLESDQSGNQLLKNIYKNTVGSSHIEEGISDVINKSNQKVKASLDSKKSLKKNIPLTKDDLRELEKLDKYRLLKIKNGQIKQKIGDLREQIQKEYYLKKRSYKLPEHENVKQSDYYSIDNPRTHQANNFVRQLQGQRREERRRYSEYMERKREQEHIKKFDEAKAKEFQAQQRKRNLEQIFIEKKMKRKANQEENSKKKADIKAWSKIFNAQKPLYIKKQEQYIENQLIPEIYNRREKLFEIKMQRRPIDMKQINEHEEKYMQYKKDDEIRHQAQKQMQQQKVKMQQQQQLNLYKGKYRYLALESMMTQKLKNTEDTLQYKKYNKAKQIVYGDQVNQLMIQRLKQKQLKNASMMKKQFTKRKRNANGSTFVDSAGESNQKTYDAKQEGKKNFYFMKQLVREKGIKKDRPIIKLIQQRGVYIDYLQQSKQVRNRQNSESLRNSKILDQVLDESKQTPIDSLLAIQRKMQQKAQRDEFRKKNGSILHEQDVKIQQNQINAAKIKLKLVRQYI